MKIEISSSGNFSNFEKYVNALSKEDFTDILKSEGNSGKGEFARNTPILSGKTAAAWDFEIEKTGRGESLTFYNSNVTKSGVPLPILIDGGHGTGTGGYVPPRPFIQNVVNDIGKKLSSDIERRVSKHG